MTIKHLRSSTANKRADPAAISYGQLVLNYNSVSPGAFFKDSAGNLTKIGPVHVGVTAPNVSPAGSAGNSTGEMWLDTSSAYPVLYVWNGSTWKSQSAFVADSIVISASKTPSSASDTGIAGQIAWDADYIYVCVATDTWKRVGISTW
jgi:hypothetical protein